MSHLLRLHPLSSLQPAAQSLVDIAIRAVPTLLTFNIIVSGKKLQVIKTLKKKSNFLLNQVLYAKTDNYRIKMHEDFCIPTVFKEEQRKVKQILFFCC